VVDQGYEEKGGIGEGYTKQLILYKTIRKENPLHAGNLTSEKVKEKEKHQTDRPFLRIMTFKKRVPKQMRLPEMRGKLLVGH